MKLRVGIIGAGRVAAKYFVPAAKESSSVQIAGIASLSSPQNAQQLAQILGCTVFGDYGSLLRSPEIDAVYIAVPNGLHARWIEEAAAHKKHVLCEKPLCATLAETEDAIANCRRSDVALLEGFAYQFHPQHARVRSLIAEGAIGRPLHFMAYFGFPPIQPVETEPRYRSELGGGALLDAGAYTIHSARRFFGREPLQVSGNLFNDGRPVDFHGAGLLDFGEGQTATVAFGFNNAYRNTYSIWGTSGIITALRAFSIPASVSPVVRLERQSGSEDIVIPGFDQFRGELDTFSEIVRDKDSRTRWYDDALAQARVIDRFR
jgi:NDP-hexose-3-ketoreductase